MPPATHLTSKCPGVCLALQAWHIFFFAPFSLDETRAFCASRTPLCATHKCPSDIMLRVGTLARNIPSFSHAEGLLRIALGVPNLVRTDLGMSHSPEQVVPTARGSTNLAQAEQDVFAAHCEHASGSLHVLAAALVGRSDAPDVVQQAFIIGLKNFAKFAPGTSFQAWMSAIVRNVARNHTRGERRYAKRLQGYSLTTDRETAQAPAIEGINPKLFDAIESLDESERSCFLLRAVRDHSYSEIAAMLDMEEATARSHVFRARKRLLTLLPPTTEAHS
jgi:RNA polymerase sigma factor (sigma-70 family)